MAADVERVAKLIVEKREWLNKSVATLDGTPKTSNPTVLICQFFSERDAFEAVARPILTKPKPKVEPPPAKEGDDLPSESKTKNAEEANKSPEEDSTEKMDSEPQVNGSSSTMDLD